MDNATKQIQIGPNKFMVSEYPYTIWAIQVRTADNKVTDEIALTLDEIDFIFAEAF